MPLALGPALSFRGSTATHWSVSILVVTDGAEDPVLILAVDKQEGPPVPKPVALQTNGALRALRFDLSIPRPTGQKETRVDYSVGGINAVFYVPGDAMPLQAAYASCNGFSSVEAMNKITSQERHAMWKSLLDQHGKKRSDREPSTSHYHLLLMGGDQLYADSVFAPDGPLGFWHKMPVKNRLSIKADNALRSKLASYYFRDLYCSRWSEGGVREALASIPSLMMWDDHDIFDGWGSYPLEWQKCHVHQTAFEIARDCFRTFQLQLAPGEVQPGGIPKQKSFSFYHQVDDVGILGLDLRSERTEDQIISNKSWDVIYTHLDKLAATAATAAASRDSLKHLLVMLSIPAVYPSFEFAERFFGWVPGQQELEDDMRDHWRSPPHKGERLRLIHNLFKFSKAAQCRVTLVSGDVHVPALGILKNNRPGFSDAGNASSITQLVSSGIVHPSAGGLTVFALDKLFAGWDEEVDRDIQAAMDYLPGTKSRLMPRRNWLALEFDTEKSKRLWATWRLENEKYPLTKVIHAV